MPVVKSRITLPDGRPARMVRVTIRIRSYRHWYSNGQGAVLGRTTVYTDDDGWWESNVVPFTAFEDPAYVTTEVTESGPGAIEHMHFIRVPDEPGPLYMRELLVNPPEPPDPCNWRPVLLLGDLLNVDRSTDTPQPGQALVAGADGRWAPGEAGVQRLEALVDVDGASLAHASRGDALSYLANGVWGLPTIVALFGLDPNDPTRMTARTQLSSGLPDRPATADWDDETDPEPITVGDTLKHTYTDPGTYDIAVAYTDGTDRATGRVSVG